MALAVQESKEKTSVLLKAGSKLLPYFIIKKLQDQGEGKQTPLL